MSNFEWFELGKDSREEKERGRHAKKREGDTREERREKRREKRSRVYVQNARVLCDTGVLKVHTGTF